jgi:hypothetical protein
LKDTLGEDFLISIGLLESGAEPEAEANGLALEPVTPDLARKQSMEIVRGVFVLFLFFLYFFFTVLMVLSFVFFFAFFWLVLVLIPRRKKSKRSSILGPNWKALRRPTWYDGTEREREFSIYFFIQRERETFLFLFFLSVFQNERE